MTELRDPRLQALFARADEPLDDADFTAGVSARIGGRIRRARLLRILVAVAVIFIAAMAAPALQALASGLGGLLTLPIIRFDNALIAQALLPINNAGGLLAVLWLVWRAFRARLFT